MFHECVIVTTTFLRPSVQLNYLLGLSVQWCLLQINLNFLERLDSTSSLNGRKNQALLISESIAVRQCERKWWWSLSANWGGKNPIFKDGTNQWLSLVPSRLSARIERKEIVLADNEGREGRGEKWGGGGRGGVNVFCQFTSCQRRLWFRIHRPHYFRHLKASFGVCYVRWQLAFCI